MIASETGTRVCTSCGEARPLEEYRYRNRGTGRRRHQCRKCWTACCRSYRARRRQAALGNVCRQLGEAGPGKVDVLVKVLLRQFGGPVRLAELLHEHTTRLAATKPGSRETLRALWAIIRLIGAAPGG